MSNNLLDELKVAFMDELDDIIEQLEQFFLELEKNSNNASLINNIFRSFHNMKGSAKTVGLTGLANLAHYAESVLNKIKSHELLVEKEIIGSLLKSIDAVKLYKKAINNGEDPDQFSKIYHEIAMLKRLLNESSSEQKKATNVENIGLFTETSDKPDQPDEYLGEKSSASSRQSNIKNEEIIKIKLSRVNELLDLFGEQVILISNLDHALDAQTLNEEQTETAKSAIVLLKKVTHDLQYTLLNLRMVSLKTIFNRLERTIRDIGQMTEKEIEFIKIGENSELDKVIVDSLIDPLNHMIRNAIDHGIENSNERVALGKKKNGKITLSARRNGANFEIILEDDGRGLDREKILEKAIKLKLLNGSGQDLTDKQVYDFIFMSGFSTREQVTEISGRGVGMDVVASQIKKIKGTYQINSKKGVGTRFILRVPLSLAIFNGTIALIEGQRYVIPNSDFKEAITINAKSDVKININSNLLSIDKRVLKIIDLRNVLEVKNKISKNLSYDKKLAIIAKRHNNEFALIVDDLISQEQIVLKRLGPEFKQVSFSSGGTILGDGKVALVLDINSIIDRYQNSKIGDVA